MNLSINHLQKELTKYHSPIKNGSNSRERSSFCFLQHDQQDFPQVFPTVLLGTNTNLKHKTTYEQRIDELFITKH